MEIFIKITRYLILKGCGAGVFVDTRNMGVDGGGGGDFTPSEFPGSMVGV